MEKGGLGALVGALAVGTLAATAIGSYAGHGAGESFKHSHRKYYI